MRRIGRWGVVLVVIGMCGASLRAQQEPQTARQALMEMFFSKAPGTFVKHLPEATRAALEKSGTMAQIEQISAFTSQMKAQGNTLQTFESGPILLTTEDPKTGQKTEVTIAKDTLRGDREGIELSFQVYKDGQPKRTPFLPLITFSMKQEEQVWRLNEISVTIHLPLADPDLLQTFTEKMKTPAQPATMNTAFTPRSENAPPPPGSDTMVLTAMRTILTAEATYRSNYPAVGYTCTLSELDGFGGGEPNEHQAMLISSGLASGKRYGYLFSLSGCGAAPASSFHLTAAPAGNTFGRKAFCADETANIRSSDDGSASMCLAGGAPVR